MSGICGIIQFQGNQVSANELKRMATAADWRGADGIYYWQQRNAGIAYLDFRIKHNAPVNVQPITNTDQSLVLVADVRLDNRQTLISKLTTTGLLKNAQPSDAEILFAGWQHWGKALADHLLGDFVLAIWDAKKQELFLARDALGGRGLFYYYDGKHCIFASEIRQLLAHPSIEGQINEHKIATFLTSADGKPAETFYKDIFSCPPAHYLTLTAGGIKKHRYWDIDPGQQIRYKDEQEYSDHFRELLTDATTCRMDIDQPVGVSLSGGLDSTLLAAIAAQNLPNTQERLLSFSYIFDELSDCDEREYIEPVVARYNLESHYLPADDLWTLKDLANWPTSQDYIWSDPYVWLPISVMQTAKQQGCRVLLNGQFGDALFSNQHWLGSMLRRGRIQALSKILLSQGLRSSDVRVLVTDILPSSLLKFWRHFSKAQNNAIESLHPDFIQRSNLQTTPQHLPQGLNRPSLQARYQSMLHNSWSDGFAEVKRIYYQHGIEVESPFFDRRIVEYIMAIPADQLGRPGRNRWLQRNAMRTLLPEAVCERNSKTTFEALMKKGLLDKEWDSLQQLMNEPLIVKNRFIQEDWLSTQLKVLPDWSGSTYEFWLFVSLELWFRRTK